MHFHDRAQCQTPISSFKQFRPIRSQLIRADRKADDAANRSFSRLLPTHLKPERPIIAESAPRNRNIRGLLTVQGSRETSLYVLDCLFSVFVVGTLVVFVWRGAWTILDIYLYPNQPDCSAWASMVSSYTTCTMFLSLWIWINLAFYYTLRFNFIFTNLPIFIMRF